MGFAKYSYLQVKASLCVHTYCVINICSCNRYSPCHCTAIECPPLDSITNGFITYAPDTTHNYDLDTVATYICNPGFFLDISLGGSPFRTCFDDDGQDAIGEFDNQTPRCIRK